MGVAMLFSLLPGLLSYKLAGRIGLAPRYVGPYFLPAPAFVANAGADLEYLSKWIESGDIKSHLSKSYSLEALPDALMALQAAGHDGKAPTASLRGKLVVQVAELNEWTSNDQ